MARRFLLILLAGALSAGAQVRLILHADDFGMSHSVNTAIIGMLEADRVSSASIMMPCPWVPEAAAYARNHTAKDIGLHLTLNSEWGTLRWPPVAGRDRVPGLVDPEGYMWRSVGETARHASAAEVETELRAQIELARRLGIRFTHLDTHMGTLYARPDYFEVFEKLGREYGVPILRVKLSPEAEAMAPAATREYLKANEGRFEKEGWLRLDSLLPNAGHGTKTYEARRAAYLEALKALPPGIHMMIVHPGVLDDELRAATASASDRDADRRIFEDPETQATIATLGIRLTGWRDLASILAKPIPAKPIPAKPIPAK